MIKKNNVAIGLILLFALITRPALAAGRVSLRLYGGLNYLNADDVNHGTRAFFDWGRTYLAPPPGGTIEGGYEPIHWGYEFGGDIIFELSPRLGIGIGAGYLKNSRNPPTYPGMMLIHDDPQGGGLIKHFYAGTTLSTIPLRLGLFLTLPLKGNLNFTANAGVSCYLSARYQAFWFVVEDVPGLLEDPSQSFSTSTDIKKAPIGFHGGLGVEYKLLAKAALFLEAQGRYARLHGFEGTSNWEQGMWGGLFPPLSETGKLYYESVPTVPGSPRWIMVQSAPPAGPEGSPRQAAVDFSGVSIRAGVRIRF